MLFDFSIINLLTKSISIVKDLTFSHTSPDPLDL